MIEARGLAPGSTTRTRILDAALAVMTEQGFEAASVDRIAERAQVAKGTVYVHFAGKRELLEAVLERGLVFPELDESTLAEIASRGLDRDRLDTLVRTFWRALVERTETLRLVVRSGSAALSEVSAPVERIRQFSAGFASTLEGLLPPGSDTSLAVRASVWALMGLFIERNLLAPEAPLSEDEVAKTMVPLLWQGWAGERR